MKQQHMLTLAAGDSKSIVHAVIEILQQDNGWSMRIYNLGQSSVMWLSNNQYEQLKDFFRELP